MLWALGTALFLAVLARASNTSVFGTLLASVLFSPIGGLVYIFFTGHRSNEQTIRS